MSVVPTSPQVGSDPDRSAARALVASRGQRIAAVACGCTLAAGAVLVASFDPSAPGSRFPACAFHATTGLWCPGCGLTRATHHLLTGDPAAALATNVFTPFVLVAIAASWLVWTLRSFGRTVPAVAAPPRVRRWAGPLTIVVVVLFGVLRNLPVAPFDALAP